MITIVQIHFKWVLQPVTLFVFILKLKENFEIIMLTNIQAMWFYLFSMTFSMLHLEMTRKTVT